MTTTETVQLDRARIKELTERESRKLDDRTPKSRELFERAKRTMPSGVPRRTRLANRGRSSSPVARASTSGTPTGTG